MVSASLGYILAGMNNTFGERLIRISAAICPLFPMFLTTPAGVAARRVLWIGNTRHRHNTRYFKIVAFLGASILITDFAFAAQIIWSGAGDLNWSTTGNWFGGVVPSATDDVKFYDDGG